MSEPAEAYEPLLAQARADPNVEGVVLVGSQASGSAGAGFGSTVDDWEPDVAFFRGDQEG